MWPTPQHFRRRWRCSERPMKETDVTPRQALRKLIAGKRYVMAPGAYDTLTARLVQLAGFEAVYLTGGGYARSNGYPDLRLLTMSEDVAWLKRTGEAVRSPGNPDT